MGGWLGKCMACVQHTRGHTVHLDLFSAFMPDNPHLFPLTDLSPWFQVTLTFTSRFVAWRPSSSYLGFARTWWTPVWPRYSSTGTRACSPTKMRSSARRRRWSAGSGTESAPPLLPIRRSRAEASGCGHLQGAGGGRQVKGQNQQCCCPGSSLVQD